MKTEIRFHRSPRESAAPPAWFAFRRPVRLFCRPSLPPRTIVGQDARFLRISFLAERLAGQEGSTKPA